MGREKRKYQRVYIRISVECRGERVWQEVEIDNISEGGVFVITNKMEKLGSPIELILRLGEKKKLVYIEGIVAWCRKEPARDEEGEVCPAGMGVQFRKFSSSESRQFIIEQIKNWSKSGKT